MKALECPQRGQQLFKWGSVYRCKNPKCKDVQMAEKLRLFNLTFDMLCKGLVIKGGKGREGGEA